MELSGKRTARFGERWLLVVIAALSLGVLAERPASAEPTSSAVAQVRAAKLSRGLFTVVGTLVSVNVSSDTLVLDEHVGKVIFRIGARVTGQTKLLLGTQVLSLHTLWAGQRMRLVLRRVPGGDEVVSGEVLDKGERTPLPQS